jgi:N-acetylglucosaminyldiphosphoundecaprenol N-acetyl-beta-D-mannosaminyltransferase
MKRLFTHLLGVNIEITNIKEATRLIHHWIQNKSPKSVFLANVHMVMEAQSNPSFKARLNASDLVLPDGKPLSTLQRLLGEKHAEQVRGEDLTLSLCQLASENNYKIGFYGSTPEVLTSLQKELKNCFHNLNIQSVISPPFRELSDTEKSNFIHQINGDHLDLLFIGLGCPKQEVWISENLNLCNCVMVGVGAAFDFISRHKPRAPSILTKFGLEWCFRFAIEPKRLFTRYFFHNSKFIFLIGIFFIRRIFTTKK